MGKFNNKIEAEFDPPRKWILSRALTYTNRDIDEDALESVGVNVVGSRITALSYTHLTLPTILLV